MIITKIIEIGVDIQNCINLYTDPDNLLRILVDKYEKRCLRGMYILKINKIEKQSECFINQDGAPTHGTINVVFEVTAIIYAVGEIINGCKVRSKDKYGNIVCNTDITHVMLNSSKILESITVGQIVSVRVGSSRYTTGAPSISVNAYPFLPTNTPLIYKLGPLDAGAKLLMRTLLKRMETEEAALELVKKANPKAYQFFTQLLYAYKEPPAPDPLAKVVSLSDLSKTTVEYVSRDPRIDLTTPNVYTYILSDSTNLIKDMSPANVILAIFEDYFGFLRTVREMIEIYSTGERLESHKNLWMIYKKAKF